MKITIIGDVSAITHAAAAAHPAVVAHSPGMTAIYFLPYIEHLLTLVATGKGEEEEGSIMETT